MRTTLWSLTALSVSLLLTGCSAVMRPTYADPPRLTIPAIAEQPCQLPMLPADPTQSDLEAAYIARGGQIVTCDAARNLAVETLKAERSMIDQWLKQRPR